MNAEKIFSAFICNIIDINIRRKDMNSIEEIKKKALENHIPIIMDDTLEVVGKILEKIKPKKILEIGTAVGYSAIRFSEYLNENGYIDTIERDEERVKEANQNIKDLGLDEKIHIFEGDALEILPTLAGPYDVVFIDAAKGKYPIFLSEALRMLANNGIIIADNILYKGYVMSDYNKHKQRTAVRGLREFLKNLNENENLTTEIIEVGDGLAISRKK
jgi:predicted O-methyltransferase YrrM